MLLWTSEDLRYLCSLYSAGLTSLLPSIAKCLAKITYTPSPPTASQPSLPSPISSTLLKLFSQDCQIQWTVCSHHSHLSAPDQLVIPSLEYSPLLASMTSTLLVFLAHISPPHGSLPWPPSLKWLLSVILCLIVAASQQSQSLITSYMYLYFIISPLHYFLFHQACCLLPIFSCEQRLGLVLTAGIGLTHSRPTVNTC